MLSAAELIEALQRRMQLVDPHRRRAAGEFPAGWQGWFASMDGRAGAVTGATADSLVELFLQRPLVQPPRRALLLNRWQAFATLWRQQWQPPTREERKLRWFAGAVSALWHVFFGALLLWLMYLQYLAISPPPQGEDVVQVEFIGVGTPAEVGGGPPPAPTSDAELAAATEAATASAVAPATATTAAAAPALDAPLPDVAQRDIPEPLLPAPSVQQPVTVSEPVPSETTVFVLPPTTARVTDAPLATPQLVAPTRPIRAVDVPEPVQPISRELPSRDLTPRPLQARLPEIATRELPAPVQRPTISELPPRAIAPPQLRAATPQVRRLDVPAPAAAAATSVAAAPSSPSASRAATSAPSAATSTSAAPSTSRPSAAPTVAASAGTGPKPLPAAGGWPTPSRADDRGEATHNRPGGQRGVPTGLYNSDGSVRLADSPGSASPGLPPGTIDDRITNLDRAGTWLKRKPNDYEPTSFDQFWRPNETLLAEWVRKSITTVRIPIPGTNKHIVCKTVLLALGGGCGITDPNLNDQPATARPPPDIPFKPALQEDNGSVRPAR